MIEKIRSHVPMISANIVFILAFNIIAFLLSNDKDTNFWCGYCFVTISWICLVAVEISGLTENHNGYFLNAPSILVSVLHIVLQLLLAIIAMVVESLSVKVVISIAVILLALYIVLINGLAYYKRKSRR